MIIYEDDEAQQYYVHEEETLVGDFIQKRELFLDEGGMGMYTKRRWDVWSVRYYLSEEEEEPHEQQVVLDLGVGVGVGLKGGMVENVDEGMRVMMKRMEKRRRIYLEIRMLMGSSKKGL